MTALSGDWNVAMRRMRRIVILDDRTKIFTQVDCQHRLRTS